MKIGLIGLGRWGKKILNTILKIENIELSCVASRNKETIKLIKNDCRIYENWNDLINHPNLQGIIIATPPRTHYQIAKISILKTIPVLIEKPLTLNLKEAIHLKNLAIKMNTILMTEFTQVFNPKFTELVKSIELINGIKSIITEAGNYGPVRKDAPVLWDWGSHELSIILSLMKSKPKLISAQRIMEEKNNLGDKSSWNIICDFENNISSFSSISNISTKKRRLGVIGNNGMLVLDDYHKYPLQFHKGWASKIFPTKDGTRINITNKNEPLLEALLEFFTSIRTNQLNHWSLDLGVNVTDLLDKCSNKNLDLN
ncbi:MAG: hypothetical protein CMK49_01025 [Prochlorococcus sp. SP3034]|nr:hypothetical protein [Prochlorococcus sp. SP3034]|tara:strand:- start:19454 stop:20395 length:942 start_codon:yes stop_codon:yes gene_type:complete